MESLPSDVGSDDPLPSDMGSDCDDTLDLDGIARKCKCPDLNGDALEDPAHAHSCSRGLGCAVR